MSGATATPSSPRPATSLASVIQRSSSELLAHRCVHRRRADGSVEAWPLDRAVDASPNAMLVSSVDGRLELALAGFGVVCVPEPAVAEHVRKKRLVSLLESSLRHPGALHAVWAPSKKTSPLLRELLAVLDEAAPWTTAATPA